MTEFDYFIDSSVWITYFFGQNPKTKNFFENTSPDFIQAPRIIYTSSISLYEVKKKFLKSGFTVFEAIKALEVMKNKAIIIDVTENICEKSAEISTSHSLCLADALIYTSARNQKTTLITLDNDFRELEGVEII